jgi:hypothetical protein
MMQQDGCESAVRGSMALKSVGGRGRAVDARRGCLSLSSLTHISVVGADEVRRRDRSAADRVLMARIAAAERWGRTTDRCAATAPARSGLRAKFEREANPDGSLPPDEVARRADHLMRAHMLRMARAAAAKRRRLT